MIWRVPEQPGHAKRSFFQEVTREKVIKVLLGLDAFEVQLNHNQHVQGHQTILKHYQDVLWMKRHGQHILNDTLNSSANQRNEQNEVIWHGVQHVLDSESGVDVTVRISVLFDTIAARPARLNGWANALIIVSLSRVNGS